MAGRRTVVFQGLAIRVSPDFWLRRWTRWPFYFESHNPSFRIDIRRVATDEDTHRWQPGQRSIRFDVLFEDETKTDAHFRDYPSLNVGESHREVIREVFTEKPGHTRIALYGQTTLYSYQVRPEESLWLAAVALPLAALGSLVTLAIQHL